MPTPTEVILALVILAVVAAVAIARAGRGTGWREGLRRLLAGGDPVADHFDRAATWTPPRHAARDLSAGPATRARFDYDLIAGAHGGTSYRTTQDLPVVVFGPPGAGKTSAIFVPAILEWAGSALVTSTSRDVLLHTVGHRAALGPVVIFGPTVRLPSELAAAVRPWTPLIGCLDLTGTPSWPATWRTAQTMVSASQDQARAGDAAFWSAKAAELLALAMWTVAVEDSAHRAAPVGAALPGTMRGVVELVAAIQSPEGAETLRARVAATGHTLAQLVADAALNLPPQTLGGMVATAMACLGAYLTSEVADAPMSNCLHPADLLHQRMTLYLLGAAPTQQIYRPIYTALLAWLIAAAEDHADASPDGRLPIPLLLAIDEAGTIAPLPDLARITATVRKAGIRLVTAWHDLSQLDARYGQAEAGTILSSAGSVLVLPGLSDQRTTDWVERAFGLREVTDETVSESDGKTRARDGDGHGSRTTTRSVNRSISRLPLVPAGAVPTMPLGTLLALIGPHRLTLHQRRWYDVADLRAVAELHSAPAGAALRRRNSS